MRGFVPANGEQEECRAEWQEAHGEEFNRFGQLSDHAMTPVPVVAAIVEKLHSPMRRLRWKGT
jgi:hypothetical protein